MRLEGWRDVLVWGAVGAAAFEAVTLLLRFGFDLRGVRDTPRFLRALTFGVRVHHGLIGAALIVIALALNHRYATFARWVGVAGIALVLSDLVHHFLVLWPLTGSPEL